MKVTDRQHTEHLEGTPGARASSVKKKSSVATKDLGSEKIREELGSAKVNLSDRAQEMKKIRAAVDSAPDVDEAKVAKFKNLVNSGNYKVDAKATADKMVDEHAYNDLLMGEEE